MAHGSDVALGAEWAFLELLSRGPGGTEDRDELQRLVRDGLDWGELLDQAIRHRMLTMVAHAVVTERLTDVPLRLAEHLRNVLAVNRYRRGAWYGEVGRVTGALETSGLRVAARKAAAYEPTVYAGDGRRWLGDIDLLVRPEDREQTAAVLASLGYEVGLYDDDAGVVVPFPREELIKYRLNPDHLPTHSLVTGDVVVPVLEVDVATSLTWARAPYHVSIDDALATVEHEHVAVSPPVSVPRLGPAFQFLDTVLHLFREARFEWWLKMQQDVDLMKFGDVIRLWEAHASELTAGAFLEQLEEYGVVEPVAWVLEHVDRTFGLETVAALGLAGRVDDAFLAGTSNAAPPPEARRVSMRERLHSKDRARLLGGAYS